MKSVCTLSIDGGPNIENSINVNGTYASILLTLMQIEPVLAESQERPVIDGLQM